MTGIKYAPKKYNNKKYLKSLIRTQGVYNEKPDKYNRLGSKPHAFRATLTATILMDTTINKQVLADYSLDDFGTYGTALANLFDQYKLAGLKAKMLSLNPCDFLNYGSSYSMALQFNVIDYSDRSSTYGTADDILQLDTCMVNRVDQHWTRYFRPKVAATNETSNYPTIYDDEQPFLSTTNVSVQYIGMKFLIEPPGAVVANLTPHFQLFNTYFWLFKNQNS